jgi:hypothetical protein
MDEAAYRQKFSELIERPCTFEMALLAGCVACRHERRIQIAEREAISCRNAGSLGRCTSLHDSLRQNFAFALGLTHEGTVISHAKDLRVQCGGLSGIQHVASGSSEVENVDGLLDAVLQLWGDMTDIPYSEVVHAAALSYKGRRD